MSGKVYSYYSTVHRAFAHVPAKSKHEVQAIARSYGDVVKLKDIRLLMVNNKYVNKFVTHSTFSYE